MGANFQTAQFRMCTGDELQKKFAAYQQEECREHGEDTYAGHLGIVNGLHITNREFPGINEAYDWLIENQQKWSPAIAVRIGSFGKSAMYTPAIQKITDSLRDVTGELENFSSDILTRAKAGKSDLRGCKHCDSRINIKKFRPVPGELLTACPVCGGNLLVTDTDMERKKRLAAKQTQLRVKLAESTKNIDMSKEPQWLIGAWCAS